MPGAEPFSHQGGPQGVLVLHGFTGNPQSMRPLAEALAQEGYTVELPLWPGHGTAIEDMIPTRWSDYAGQAEPANYALFPIYGFQLDLVSAPGLPSPSLTSG